MFLYWIESERRYVHRKDDIPKGEPVDRRDIATDTIGLMTFLNGMIVNPVVVEEMPTATDQDVVDSALRAHESARAAMSDQPIKPPMSAIGIMSRMDSPGIDVEGVIETICKARGYALARYAGAVAIRYQELEKI